jgi:putative transposase
VLEAVRQHYNFVIVGYVVMPEHIHLLLSEPEKGDPSKVMQAIKQGFARRVLRQLRQCRLSGQATLFGPEPGRVWQRRFYDFNVWSARKRIEKLRYMHRNPVARGLLDAPEQWAWSSFRAYAYGEVGIARVNDWPAAKMTTRKQP